MPRPGGTVGKFLHAMHDADGEILAAGGAKAAVLPGLLRFQTHAAVAMSIQVIFAFFGKKLDSK